MMEPPDQSKGDAILARVLQRLSHTPYTCSSLTLLGGGSANFVYRGTLAPPISSQSSTTPTAIHTIIIKHYAAFLAVNSDFKLDASRAEFEARMLIAFSNASVKQPSFFMTPRLYLFDREANTQVHQDFSGATALTYLLVSPTVSRSLVTAIGHSLGLGLRSLHRWASEHAQADLRADIGKNEPMRKLKYYTTYSNFIQVLESFPRLLEGHRETFEAVKSMAKTEYEKVVTDGDEDWGVIHGDFWTGNVLVPEDRSKQHRIPSKLIVIDWELAQFGCRAYDLGQMIGDLYEKKLLDNADSAIWALEGFADGYGGLSDEMVFRSAIHAGVHFIHWYIRRPPGECQLSDPQYIESGMKLGVELILKGWKGDKNWFRGTAMAQLFDNP